MIDAALALQGEESGEVVHGAGAVIGDPGPEKYKIEESCTRNNIPLMGIVIKMSLAEAISPMTLDVLKGVRRAVNDVLAFIESLEDNAKVLIAGIGNTMGVGYVIGGEKK